MTMSRLRRSPQAAESPGPVVRISFLPLLILALPLIEIAGFVIVGSQVGVLATIGLVLLSAIVGALLLRVQGLGTVQRIRLAMTENRTPGRELVHGVMIVLAAMLLIVPGFFTDIFGILLFIPPVRERVYRFLSRHVTVITPGRPGAARPAAQPRGQIDLDATDFHRDGGSGDSPWRDGPR